MNGSPNAEANLVHISGRGQMLRAAIFGGAQRALCGASLEDEDGEFIGVPCAGICRPCAARARWTETQIAEADALWSAS